ncbi:hypothetical protein [Heyndrickxia vini]|uniref:Uncharacterized protein n=1 Tax=Heyndrickxia vini TaxID=1476025 RepID=A0ABX7DWK9_9BACI|nr:hypothetical protein [Heyndrickxia vini]QQZ07831.1 hypothetical protein I5776_12080 [Heyndrickxia vini]
MRNESQKFTILLSTGIIFILASMFFPLFLGSIIRDTFFKPRGAFGYSSDTISFFLQAGSFIIIGIMFILLAIDAIKVKIRVIISTTLFIIAAIIAVYSTDNYYYGTEKGFYYNDLTSIGTKEIQWENVSEVEQVYKKVDGNLEESKLIFKRKDGQKVEVNYYTNLYHQRNTIVSYVENYGGKSVITELEEDSEE